ncbi:MAG: hypothetical protein O2968_16180 [Acidobacteria bacterium]|nr:hypothetical protein [Acidobacteriota bacterium]
MILKRIGVLSLARMLGGLYATIGLIVGVIFSLASMLGALGGLAAATGANTDEAAGALMALIPLLFGVGAIVFFPLFYGLMGFVGGALAAFFFNLLAGVFGGIEMTFVNLPGAPVAPTTAASPLST